MTRSSPPGVTTDEHLGGGGAPAQHTIGDRQSDTAGRIFSDRPKTEHLLVTRELYTHYPCRLSHLGLFSMGESHSLLPVFHLRSTLHNHSLYKSSKKIGIYPSRNKINVLILYSCLCNFPFNIEENMGQSEMNKSSHLSPTENRLLLPKV